MLTTKKWGAVLLLMPLLVGCDPPGRQAVLKGERFLEEGRPAEAVAPLREAITLLGTNTSAVAQAWNDLGLAYHYSGNPTNAALAYQNALAKDFNLFAARYNRGCLYLEQNNLPAAVTELTTYTAHRPKDPAGWLKLGTAQLHARLFDAADHSCQMTLELNPPPPAAAEALNDLGMSQALRRRPHEAFRYFYAALKLQTNYAPALLNQAVVAQQQLNDRSLALQKYRAYLATTGNASNLAVLAVANQLEAELRPREAPTNQTPGAIATNALLRPTNLLAGVPTSPPPAIVRTNVGPPPTAAPKAPPPTNPTRTSIPTPPTAPPTNRVEPKPVPETPTPKVAATNPPAPPQPPVQLVQLQNEPAVKTAQDVSPATSPTTPPPTPANTPPSTPPPTSAPPAPVTPTASPAARPGLAASQSPPEQKPPKRSLIQRLNPLNLLHGKSKTEPPVTSLPSGPTRPVRTELAMRDVPTNTSPPPSSPPSPAAPPAPVFPRYRYAPPAALRAGDRAQADRLFAAGVQAQNSGNPRQAITTYQEAAVADPSCFEVDYNLAIAAYAVADWALALKAGEAALALRPNDANARFNFALALEKANYPVDAANELERVLSTDPRNVDAHFTLANLCAQTLGDRKRASDHYQKVIELNPHHPRADPIRRWLSVYH